MVSIDVTSDDENAKKFLTEKGITFPSLRGTWQGVAAQYGVDGTPANFVIDRRGRILYSKFGFGGEKALAPLAAMVEAALARQEPAAVAR